MPVDKADSKLLSLLPRCGWKPRERGGNGGGPVLPFPNDAGADRAAGDIGVALLLGSDTTTMAPHGPPLTNIFWPNDLCAKFDGVTSDSLNIGSFSPCLFDVDDGPRRCRNFLRL